MIVSHRVTKQAARYTPAGGVEKCALCRFFAPQGWCGKVLGPVSAAGWCKYYSREAVQRWSHPGVAGAGLSGLPPGVSLSLNFMTAGALDPRITFTRASTATYTDSTGTIQTAATNAPRWDYDPVTHQLRGLLIEEARTNIALQSANVANAAWLSFGVGTTAPPVTANQTNAPDGTVTGASIVYPAIATAGWALAVYQSLTATAAPYTFSIYLKGAVGGEQVYVYLSDGASAYPARQRATLTTAWQRVSVTATLTAATWYGLIGTDLRPGSGQSATLAQTVYAWGGQIEQGAFATSYIPTTAAAVTRAIDQCAISPPLGSWFVTTIGSWFAEFVYLNPSPNNSRIVTTNNISGSWAPIFITPPTVFGGQYDGVAAVNSLNAISVGAVNKVATTWIAGQAKACSNGGAVATSTALTQGYFVAAGNGVFFMTPVPTPSGDNTTGYLRRVTYWPRVLSDAEMIQVTT